MIPTLPAAACSESYQLGSRVTGPIKAGKTVNIIGNPDAAHSWTAMNDVAVTLVELGSNSDALGKAWHIPTAEPLTQRQVIERPAPAALLTVMGLFQPIMRELKEILYQFDSPFIIDSTAATKTFGLKPASLEESLRLTLG